MENQKKFNIGIYCPPPSACGVYESRVTDKVYKLLADAGVNEIYGYYEDEAGTIEDALRFCEKYHLKFFARLAIFRKFLQTTGVETVDGNTSFADMSKQEQDELVAQYMEELNKWKDYSAFAGVYFGDENGVLTFEGIRKAKDIFYQICPDKEFRFNSLNYQACDDHYFALAPQEKRNTFLHSLPNIAENRFARYRLFLDYLVEKIQPNTLSTDVYVFLNIWKEVPKAIHRALYEINAFYADYKKHYACDKVYQAVQVGTWGEGTRAMNKSELALNVNTIVAYGHNGFYFFPGCYPNDWLMSPGYDVYKDGQTGLLDVNGEPTKYYDFAKEIIQQVQKCATEISGAKHLGVFTVGQFDLGVNGVDVNTLTDGDCIYNGALPPYALYQGEKPNVVTNKQLLVGVFENCRGQKNYYIVNNSVEFAVDFSIETQSAWKLIQDGKEVVGRGNIAVEQLKAGESTLLCLL